MPQNFRLLKTRKEWGTTFLNLMHDSAIQKVTVVTFRIGHPYTLRCFYTPIAKLQIPFRLLVGLTDENVPKQEVPDSVLSKAKEFMICAGNSASLRTIQNCHEKISVFQMRKGGPKVIVGSRNFNQSSWYETCLLISGDAAVELADRAENLWQEGKQIRPSPFERLLREEYLARHQALLEEDPQARQ